MRKTLMVFSLTLFLLAALDTLVATTLGWAERSGHLGALIRYFEYGRSVPGKLAQWEQNPDIRGNLYDVAWRQAAIVRSAGRFETEDTGPVIRSYGMSFVNNILRNAVKLQPDLIWDAHAGPSAPPNFTFALFQEDRENRRPGDIVVLGILSSSVPGMAALSNRTWAFEQPAPFTYPVYWPEGDRLRRVEPLISSAAEQRALADDPAAARAWSTQMAAEDAFTSPITFGAVWADHLPFLRLVRRSLAKSHIASTEDAILAGEYPYAEVLQRMIAEFSDTARADGQTPIVMLIQSRDPRDADVLAIAKPILERDNILYLATAEHFDPRDPSGFLGDGHYKPRVDRLFAEHFIDAIEQ